MTSRINSEFITRNWAAGNRADKFANVRRWRVALPAFRAVGKRNGDTQRIANAIREANECERPIEDTQDAPVDVVERLASAYKYFIKLLEIDSLRARQSRRRYGYSRFALMWNLWLSYEFDIREKGFEYLELGMSNAGMELFVINVEDEVPEWKRRAADGYSRLRKLVDDYGTPDKLREAARQYVAVYDEFYPPVTKDYKRKEK